LTNCEAVKLLQAGGVVPVVPQEGEPVGPEPFVCTNEIGGQKNGRRHVKRFQNRKGIRVEVEPSVVKSNGA